jgi:cytochrome c oxidase subunit 1
MFSKKTADGTLDLPVSEALHDEKRIPLFDSFKPWLIIMGIIILLAYIPAFMNASRNPGPGAPPFTPENPVPEKLSKTANPYNQ